MDLLLQLQADHLGIPVRRPVDQETTALGAAFLAGLAEGVWPDLDAIERRWATDVLVEPRAPESFERLVADVQHHDWRRAVERSRRWAHD
jgi:glycerol kinase